MSIQKWLKKNTASLSGKTVAITGSTGGLGKELCKYLAALGASLVLVDRNLHRSEQNKADILSLFPETEVHLVTADLEKMISVKKAADILKVMPIDVLILNAGAYGIPVKICETGYCNVFQINFISQYYLARALAPSLKKRGGKIVAVGSIANKFSKTTQTDIDFANRSNANLIYGNAKRYLIYALYGLSEKENVPVSISHPGITFTNITSNYPPFLSAVIKYPMKIIFMNPKKACLSVLKGVFNPCEKYRWIGPAWFNIWGLPQEKHITGCNELEYEYINKTAEEIYQNIRSTM